MSLIPISSVFPIRGKWSLRATSSDNTPKPRLGLLISDRFPSMGYIKAHAWKYSGVALTSFCLFTEQAIAPSKGRGRPDI
jgi:hypothetical protein